MAHFGCPVFVCISAATYQLQVIHDDQPDVLVAVQKAPGHCADLGDGPDSRVLNINGCRVQFLHGFRHPPPFVILEFGRLQIHLVNAANRTYQPRGELISSHLHRDHQDGKLFLQRAVLGHVHGQRGLTHCGSAGDNYQVAFFQTTGHLVKIRKASGHAYQFSRVF